MELHKIFLMFMDLSFLAGMTDSEYNIRVGAASEMVNEGDNFVAYCNIPDMGALDIITNLVIRWLHNDKPLTNMCELLDPFLASKYSCRVVSPQQNNISLELTILDIKKEDAGILECDVLKKIRENGKWIRNDLVSKLPLHIKLREQIKSLVFKFDSSRNESLTQDNNEVILPMLVPPGYYSPYCNVEGGVPLADVQIMMGETQMPGILLKNDTAQRTEFLAFETEFKAYTQTSVKCISEVPGLPNSKMERTFQIVAKIFDPKFMCSNNSVIVNNKRHVITCKMYGVEGIMCYKVKWQIGEDEEYLIPGGYNDVTIACRELNTSMIETTLEILQVTAEDFKIPFYVIYSEKLAGNFVYQLHIPQEIYNRSNRPESIFQELLALYIYLYLIHLKE